MTRKDEIKAIIEALIEDVKICASTQPMLIADRIVRNGELIKKHQEELKQLEQ